MEKQYVLDNTIFETVIGSRAYGIHTETSDYDKAGVMIPGKEYFFGFDRFEQYQSEEDNKTIYDIRKAVALILQNNPNCMDLLFMPERCIVKMTPYWQRFVDIRDVFVSKKCRYTFSGYAISQLNRIRTHRKFILNPPKALPTREQFGLPENSMFPTSQLKAVLYSVIDIIIEEEKENFIDELDGIYRDYVTPLFARFIKADQRGLAQEWLQMGVRSQAKTFHALGAKYIKDEYLDQAEREVKFYSAMQEWQQYQAWKAKRNKARAELEVKFGMDTKHLAHLVRLFNMGVEIMTTGKVNVDRTGIDADYLKAIRFDGVMKFEEAEQFAKDRDQQLDSLYKLSALQKSPQVNKVKELCVDTVENYLYPKGFLISAQLKQ